jgi:hypothetical protein
MKVLIYVEPHPVRDIKHFSAVARGFLPLLSSASGADVRLFANGDTLEGLSESLTTEARDRVIWPTKIESAMIKRCLDVWQNSGIPMWSDLMAGQGAISVFYHEILHRLWNIFPFDVIIHWGENGAVGKFAAEYDVVKIAMELGCTRKPYLGSIVMDPYGSNGSGLIAKLSTKDLVEVVGDESITREMALFAFSNDLETRGYSEQFTQVPPLLNEKFRDGKLVFLPLQLFDDANLLKFSKYDSLTEVVLDVVPRLAQKGYTVIVKQHPDSIHRKGAELANALARDALSSWSSNVIWDESVSRMSNSRLFSMSEFVVTVNSSVGFEALYYDKPVVVLGEAVYKPEALFPTISDMLEGKFDKKTYLANVEALRTFLLGSYLIPDTIFKNPQNFIDQIALVVRASRLYSDQPAKYAQCIFNRSIHPRLEKAESMVRSGITNPVNFQFKSYPISPVAPGEASQNYSVLQKEVIALHSVVQGLVLKSHKDSVEKFTLWIESIWNVSDTRATLLSTSGLLSPDYYAACNPDVVTAAIDPLEHYCNQGILEARSPREEIIGYNADSLLTRILEVAATIYTNRAKHQISNEALTHRAMQLTMIQEKLENTENRVVVVAHMYYSNLVPELLVHLANIPEKFDLIVTTPDWGFEGIVKTVTASFPEAVFYHATNRGRDIAPFLDILPLLLSIGYDVALKIQTKNGYYQAGRLDSELGRAWREQTYEALLGTPGRVDKILKSFSNDENLNLVGAEPYLQPLGRYPYHDNGSLALSVMGPLDTNSGDFFAGTMFWFKPECFRCFIGLDLRDFLPESGDNDGALAHLFERMFGHAGTVSNGTLATAPTQVDKEVVLAPEGNATSIHDYLVSHRDSHLARKLSQTELASSALFW